MSVKPTTRTALFGCAFLFVSSSTAPSATCGFRYSFERLDEQGARKVRVFEGESIASMANIRPLLFISSLKVNTDGTRISYHQNDPAGTRCVKNPSEKICAINNIRNAYRNWREPLSDFIAVRDAGYPKAKTWRVLSPNIIEKDKVTGKPCLTKDGYLVSMTADVAVAGGWGRVGDCDQSKWIDALTMPAIVLPKKTKRYPSQFNAKGIRKRSLVVTLVSGGSKRTAFGIVGDYGPANEIGEANIALNRKLSGLAATDVPKHRQDAKAATLIFPTSNFVLSRPISGKRISGFGADALAKFGGVEKLYSCIRAEVDSSF